MTAAGDADVTKEILALLEIPISCGLGLILVVRSSAIKITLHSPIFSRFVDRPKP